jgi:hypothetical protein
MKPLFRAAVAAAVLAPFAVTPAEAQRYRFDVGVNGGFAWYTESLDEPHVGTLTQDARFKPGWILGGQLTFWPADRFGIRANGAWSERPLERVRKGDLPPGASSSENIAEDVNLWSWSGDLMFRFARPRETWAGTEFLPYIAAGLGVKSIHPAIEDPTTDPNRKGVIFEMEPGQRFLLNHQRTLMGLLALGADLRMAPRFAVRLEVGDRIWDSPMYRLDANNPPGFLEPGNEDVGEVVHELYGTVGLHWLMGLRPVPVVAIVPPPPAPPPVQPPPPPPPAEERLMVCVIDPTAPGGVRMQEVFYRPATRDTVIVRNGERVALRTTLGDVRVAADADWFVQGRPLAVTSGRQRVEFVTYGTSRLIEANDLVFLGTVNGVPIYASATDAQPFRADLEQARTTLATQDLLVIMQQRPALYQRVQRVDILYAPLQPIGCIFQPLQRVEPTLKGGKL